MRPVTFPELQERHPRLFATAQWSNCPTGWLPLLAELCERLEAEHPGVSFAQVKDKFAELRIDLTEGGLEEYALINEYVRRSRKTCEVCGAPGERFERGHWLFVRCGEHAK